MKFDKNHPKFTAYALGELSKEDHKKAKDYLGRHPELTEQVDEIRALGTALIQEFKTEPMPKLKAVRQNRIMASAPAVASKFYQRPPFMVGASLMMLAIILVVTFGRNSRDDQSMQTASRSIDKKPSEKLTAKQQTQINREPLKQINIARNTEPSKSALGSSGQSAPQQTTHVANDGLYDIADHRGQQRSPDMKLAGPKTPGPNGVQNNKMSGVNLSKLGIGVGKVLDKDSSGAIRTTFRDSAGGAGGGSGSGKKNYGFGGAGSGGLLSGDGGTGGFGGSGIGRIGKSSGYNQYTPPSVESYEFVPENDFVSTAKDSLSTFAIDVDTASYSNVRRFLNNGQMPPADAVRIEEMINYFDYDYKNPVGDKAFAVDLAVSASPWKSSNRLVGIGIKAKDYASSARPRLNLTFLIDVSGSMDEENKLPLLKRAFKLLAEQLTANDTVTIVTYAGNSGVHLEPTPGNQYKKIMDAVESMSAGGSTNGSAGLDLAYQKTQAHMIKNGVNRVIIASDGDFNVGVTSRTELHSLIEGKARTGIQLSVLGFGMGNYKDSTLELLADKGDGNYAYVDDYSEAQKVFSQQLTGTLITVAKDTKIQVEFNPKYVESFRLIGYENRKLAHQDFADDTKDAGEIGAGHSVTALYEVVPVGYASHGVALKYSTKPTNPEILTVKLRYKKPLGGASQLQEHTVHDSGVAFNSAPNSLRWAGSVAAFGMLLKNSKYKGEATYGSVESWANSAIGSDRFGHRKDFLKLIAKAKSPRPAVLTPFHGGTYNNWHRPGRNISIPEGDPRVSGGLTSQEVMQVIRANLNQIRHCYEQLLQRSPNARGKIGVNFVIGLDGRVTSVNIVAATISDMRMGSCVTGKIQRWNFPKPRGGQAATAEYPFVFSPI